MHLSRRNLGRLALAAVPVTRLLGAKPNSKFGGVQVGINVPYSFHNLPGSADDIVKYCAQTNINALELRSQPVEAFLGAPPIPPRIRPGTTLTPEQQAERRRAADDLQKWRLSRSTGDFRKFRSKYEDTGMLIQIVKIDGIDEMPDDVVEYCFEMARTLGAYAISCEILVSRTKRLGAFAEKHKLMVGYHGHGNITNPEAFGNLSSWERAMSYSKYNGANIDIGHFFAANGFSPAEWIKANHRRVTHVHLKDREAHNGPNMPFGQGDSPLKEILLLMKKEKYRFQATIEFEYKVPEGSDLLTEVGKCVRFCEDILA